MVRFVAATLLMLWTVCFGHSLTHRAGFTDCCSHDEHHDCLPDGKDCPLDQLPPVCEICDFLDNSYSRGFERVQVRKLAGDAKEISKPLEPKETIGGTPVFSPIANLSRSPDVPRVCERMALTDFPARGPNCLPHHG